MSTNGIHSSEDAEMADCDGDKVVTMMDVLKEQEDFEEDANAVLGASDDKNCTYSKGYVKRQALYACMTCTDAKNDATKRAGVCLACSLTCHENHELIELYTKRHFRCDCGNPKFNSHPCQFTPDKTNLNTENIYNQNFSGVYCICHRPYPDPESSAEGDMIQCIICEDWLHCNHLDAVVPSNEQYSEMVCKACMDKNDFLHDYSDLTVNKESMDVDVVNTSSEAITNCNENSTSEIADDKENVNSSKDNTVTAQIENDPNSKEENDENDNKNHSTDKLDPAEEEEGTENLSESAQITSNEQNSCTLEKDNKNETELKNEAQPEDIKSLGDTTNDNPGEKPTSQIEDENIPLNAPEIPDNRSQEQVEEDLLLQDPTDTDLDHKKVDVNVVSTSVIQSSTNSSIDEKKSEPDSMEISADNSENVTTAGESKNTITVDQSETVTPSEQTVTGSGILLEDETTAKNSEVEQAENAANIDNAESTLTTDQSNISSTSDIQESISATKEPQNETDQIDTVSTNEQSDEHDKNDIEKAASENEKEITSENANNLEKESSTDIPMPKKNSDATLNDTLQKDNTENNSNLDKNELSDKTIDTDILKRKLSTDDGDIEIAEVKKPKLESSKCIRPKGVKRVHNGATFWPSTFRTKLCTCNECLSMYKDLSVLFLIDPEDTVTAYEQLGKERTDGKPASQYEKGMAALSSLGRVQQINALTEYAKLRDKLLDFLKTFKDKKVIVKEEDIKAFFAGMKPVREPDGVYFCR